MSSTPGKTFQRGIFGPWSDDPVWIAMVNSLAGCQIQWTLMELFGGLGTAFIGFAALCVHVTSVYFSDKNSKLLCWLAKLHSDLSHFHMTDIMSVDIHSLPSVDVIIAGPPCQPWSAKGIRGSWDDPRAAPFIRTLDIIIYMALQGALKFFIIENVAGVTHRSGDTVAPIIEIVDYAVNYLAIGLWITTFTTLVTLVSHRTGLESTLLAGECHTRLPSPIHPIADHFLSQVCSETLFVGLHIALQIIIFVVRRGAGIVIRGSGT